MRGRQQGFTMIELMVALSVTTIIVGVLYSLSFSMMSSVRSQDAQITMMEEGRNAMQSISRNLRMSSFGWIQTLDAGGNPVPLGGGPVTSIVYRRPDDLDGNGNALDAAMNLELRPGADYHDRHGRRERRRPDGYAVGGIERGRLVPPRIVQQRFAGGRAAGRSGFLRRTAGGAYVPAGRRGDTDHANSAPVERRWRADNGVAPG
jgi:prepilin-type N-terminal cleavage/methylation domain-containing protein